MLIQLLLNKKLAYIYPAALNWAVFHIYFKCAFPKQPLQLEIQQRKELERQKFKLSYFD